MKDRATEDTLFDYAPDAILIIGRTGRITRVNPQAERLFGYTAEELQGQPVEVVIPERFRGAHSALRNAYGKDPQPRRMAASAELWARHKSGNELAVEIALGPQGRDIVCIIRDISERQRAQAALQGAHDELEARVLERTRELETANAALERSNRELQDFAYVASHDLQEPLRKIRTFGERLGAQASTTLDEQSQDYLARMQNAAERMQKLIEDLLAFSRVATRAEPVTRVSLDAILRDVLADLEIAIEESRARIETARTLGEVDGDATQLRQLLQNLVANALKFRDASREHVVSIFAERSSEQKKYMLSVKDNGIGFEQRNAERIFGLFQRLHGRASYEGSGVGLAICRKIAERHGGSISASASPGEGALFTVVLPLSF